MKSSNMKIVLVLVVVAICLVLSVCVFCVAFFTVTNQVSGFNLESSVKVGQAAPNFQLETIDGERVSLQDYRGHPVLINFWAIWCGPCKEEMPVIQDRFSRHYPGLVVLAIEEGDSLNILRDYVDAANLTFLVLMGDDAIARSYNIFSYPTSYFVDAEGVVRSVVVGSMSSVDLDAELTKIGVGD